MAFYDEGVSAQHFVRLLTSRSVNFGFVPWWKISGTLYKIYQQLKHILLFRLIINELQTLISCHVLAAALIIHFN